MGTKGIFFERELNGQTRDFCRIEIAGVRDIWEGPARPEDIQRFPAEWEAFKKKGKRKKPKGSKLAGLPGMTEPRRCELELNNIETVEQLAAAEETTLRNIGEPYVELAKIAKLQVEAAKNKKELVDEVVVSAAALKNIAREVTDEPADNSASS
jgi:hypothetical protein